MKSDEVVEMNPNTPTSAITPEQVRYQYGNAGWPRDFDIRIEVAEQREVLMEPCSSRISTHESVSGR